MFVYLLESPRRGDSVKSTKCMIHKKNLYPLFMLLTGPRVYNSKFDFKAKYLVTSILVISRVLCSIRHIQ